MADAAAIDLERIKVDAETKKKSGVSLSIPDKRVRIVNEKLIDYTKTTKKSIIKENDKATENWSLNSKQRLFLATFCICTSLGYGRASLTVPTSLNPVIEIFQSVSLVFIAFSFVYSVLCAKRATELNKNGSLWGIKGFLGGPFSYNEITMNLNEDMSDAKPT